MTIPGQETGNYLADISCNVTNQLFAFHDSWEVVSGKSDLYPVTNAYFSHIIEVTNCLEWTSVVGELQVLAG